MRTRCTFNSTRCQGMCTDTFYFSVKEQVPTHFSVKKWISLGGKKRGEGEEKKSTGIHSLTKECFNLLFVTGSQFRRLSTRKLELWFVLTRKLLFWTATGAGAELLKSKPPVNNTKEQICMTLALTWVTWKQWNVFFFYWTHKKQWQLIVIIVGWWNMH